MATVIQADRDAAHKVRFIQLGHTVKMRDEHSLVQAFAHHRENAIRHLADALNKIADGNSTCESPEDQCMWNAAVADAAVKALQS